MAILARTTDRVWMMRKGEGFEAWATRTNKVLDDLCATSRKLKHTVDGKLEGAILRFPVADGYAFYRVVKTRPLTVAHIPYGDAWDANPILIRGLVATDVRKQLAAARALHKLFGS